MATASNAHGAGSGLRGKDEFRARPVGYQLRNDNETGMPTLVGHLAVFDQWTEINSRSEGHFLERIAPGAFTKTVQENLPKMRCLFQHGMDPVIAEKPLGPIVSIEPDDEGMRYEVPLLDTSYNRDLVELLRADPPVLGSSFRFAVTREDIVRKPGRSDYNPKGLPERTVQELRLSEFGPVTFPAYQGAGAGLRSLTDRMAGLETPRSFLNTTGTSSGSSTNMTVFLDGVPVVARDLSADADDEPDVIARMLVMASDWLEDTPEEDPATPVVVAVRDMLTTLVHTDDLDDAADSAAQDGQSQEGDGTADTRTSANNDHAGISHLVTADAATTPLYPKHDTEVPSWHLP